MDTPHPAPATPAPSSPTSRLPWLAALGVLVAAAGLAWWWFRGAAPEPVDPDPRLTFPTVYRNVRPTVKYVGDAECSFCHADIATDYQQHPMGKSLAPIASAEPLEKLDANSPFRSGKFEYAVEKMGDAVVHHERLRDADGKELLHVAEPVAFAIGSGGRGRSYLIQRGQQLFQSPVSWFSHTGQWDLSPGYEKNHSHFDRPIPPRCLYCHANQIDAVPGALNLYNEPIFHGHTIGCERCHGPGELHAHRQLQGERYAGTDDTIVNPRRLEPALRDDVCAQCHLQGEQRTIRRGRTRDEYRPGLPLSLFQVVFVRHPDLVDYRKSVGQFEQLAISKCAQESKGALGCISCHDPHRKPSAKEAPAYFRARCAACHGPERVDCSAPLAQREQENGNSCIACHMPRGDSSNVVHTSVTDHRIVRRPVPSTGRPRRALMPDETPIVAFHEDRFTDDPDFDRDLGIALVHVADTMKTPSPALQAHRRLYDALQRRPDDIEAREMFGLGLLWQQDFAAARKAFAEVLKTAPRREPALFHAAQCERSLNQPDAELPLVERLLVLNPNNAAYWVRLAELRIERQEWDQAKSAAERAVTLSPTRVAARRALMQALVGHGDIAAARRHLPVYEALGADDVAEVRRWFRP